jgi:hypothetical protein
VGIDGVLFWMNGDAGIEAFCVGAMRVFPIFDLAVVL